MISGGLLEGGHVGGLGNADWLDYGLVDFGSGGLNQIQSLVSGGSTGSGLVSYRVDSPTGPLLGNFAVGNTGWVEFVSPDSGECVGSDWCA